MPGFQRTSWRAAGRMEESLRPRPENSRSWRLNRTLVETLPKLAERLELAVGRGWNKAARHMRLAMHSQLLHFKTQINDALHQLETSKGHQTGPSQALIYAELGALSEEFEDFEIDLRKQTVAVVTESIVIDDIDLGRFRIVLDWKKCEQRDANVYSVTALTPNCPASNSHITHPHVLNHSLCEGDATIPLKQALRSGRLCDFFQIIQCVLRTYNSDSPYAALDEWSGVDCHACGTHIPKDADYCGHCNTSVCESCRNWCEHCESSRCEACLGRCSKCEDHCCPNCLRLCLDCRVSVCPNCLTSNELCQNCDHETTSNEPQESTSAETDCP
jgi:hypothetical protein